MLTLNYPACSLYKPVQLVVLPVHKWSFFCLSFNCGSHSSITTTFRHR